MANEKKGIDKKTLLIIGSAVVAGLIIYNMNNPKGGNSGKGTGLTPQQMAIIQAQQQAQMQAMYNNQQQAQQPKPPKWQNWLNFFGGAAATAVDVWGNVQNNQSGGGGVGNVLV